MPRIFIVSEKIKEKYCLDSMAEYGVPTYLYADNERMPSYFNPTLFAQGIAQRLQNNKFDPDIDCIALTGKHTEVAILFYIVGLLCGDVGVILFDAKQDKYVKVDLQTASIPDILETTEGAPYQPRVL
jgi:hypothetical protein